VSPPPPAIVAHAEPSALRLDGAVPPMPASSSRRPEAAVATTATATAVAAVAVASVIEPPARCGGRPASVLAPKGILEVELSSSELPTTRPDPSSSCWLKNADEHEPLFLLGARLGRSSEDKEQVVVESPRARVWALQSIDPDLVEAVCSASNLQELKSVPVPFSAGCMSMKEATSLYLGSWMIWIVHRAWLNDPSLTVVDFSGHEVPRAEEEPRILPKLLRALPGNSFLQQLLLADCNLGGGGELAHGFSSALAPGPGGAWPPVKVLDLARNLFQPEELQQLFLVLRSPSLEVLRVGDQYSERPVGWETFQALHGALKSNFSLRKLGLDLTDAHWRDQINRCIIRNVEQQRRSRARSRPA